MRFETVIARLAQLPDPLPHGIRAVDPVLLGRPSALPDWTRSEPGVAGRAAALVLLFPDASGEARVVLTERPDGLRHAGQVSFPGGKEDPGDDFPVGTALREALEEVGLDAAQAGVRIMGRLDVVDVRVSGFMLTPVIALAALAPTLVASPREVAVHPAAPGRHIPAQRAGDGRRDGARRLPHPLRRISVRGPPHLGCDGACPRPAWRGPRPGGRMSHRRRAFIRHWTTIECPPLVPEIRLHLASELMPLWQALAKDASDPELPPPYWAFAWAGGQALARYVLDHPDVVRGARVLDFATGSGLCAIAALQAGATDVLGADVDPWSADAVALNAALHGVHIPFVGGDPIDDEPPDVDVILAGDIGYEWNLATRGIDVAPSRGRSWRAGVHR